MDVDIHLLCADSDDALRGPLQNINYAGTSPLTFVCSDVENHLKPIFTTVF